jgi:Tfp pilus assembly protein PilN
MKKLRLSKIAWLILAAGIFIVVLAGLGLTYSGQRREQKTLSEELELTRTRLEKTDDSQSQLQQISQLEERLVDSQGRLTEAKQKLLQAILSVDVSEKFFQIAEASGVTVESMGTTGIKGVEIGGISCYQIDLHGNVSGEFLKLVDFIVNLDQNYITGFVKTAQISVGENGSEGSSATIHVEVYSSKGLEDG